MEHQSKSNLKIAQSKPFQAYQTLDIQYEDEYGLAWYYMHPKPRPCCTPELVHEIKDWFHALKHSPEYRDVRYVALASNMPNVFNLGGDLNLVIQLIRDNDRQGLQSYATACIDAMLLNYCGTGTDITTISLIQGDALGGGMEYAISSHVLIAERNAKMGMPEILFNLFPGVGAYSFLSRKVGPNKAEEIIVSGRLYSAEEMYQLGIVDVLAGSGEGRKAVYDYIAREDRSSNGLRSFRQAKMCTNPVTRKELSDVADIWADAALRLGDKELRMMGRLVKRQTEKSQ